MLFKVTVHGGKQLKITMHNKDVSSSGTITNFFECCGVCKSCQHQDFFLKHMSAKTLFDLVSGTAIGTAVKKGYDWLGENVAPAVREGISDAWEKTKDAWDRGTDAVGEFIDDTTNKINDAIEDGQRLYEEIKEVFYMEIFLFFVTYNSSCSN